MDIPVKKNEEYIVEIVDNGFEGEGMLKYKVILFLFQILLKEKNVKF